MSWAVTMDWLRPHSIRHSQLLSEWNSLSLCINFSTFLCYEYLFIPRTRIKCDLKPNYMCVNLMDTKHLYWPTPVVQFYIQKILFVKKISCDLSLSVWKCKHVCIYLQAELTAIKVHSLKNWTILYRPETDEGSILDHYVAQLMNTKSTTQWHQVRTRPLESTRLQTSVCTHKTWDSAFIATVRHHIQQVEQLSHNKTQTNKPESSRSYQIQIYFTTL